MWRPMKHVNWETALRLSLIFDIIRGIYWSTYFTSLILKNYNYEVPLVLAIPKCGLRPHFYSLKIARKKLIFYHNLYLSNISLQPDGV